jgi:hypothetical protein
MVFIAPGLSRGLNNPNRNLALAFNFKTLIVGNKYNLIPTPLLNQIIYLTLMILGS